METKLNEATLIKTVRMTKGPLLRSIARCIINKLRYSDIDVGTRKAYKHIVKMESILID